MVGGRGDGGLRVPGLREPPPQGIRESGSAGGPHGRQASQQSAMPSGDSKEVTTAAIPYQEPAPARLVAAGGHRGEDDKVTRGLCQKG